VYLAAIVTWQGELSSTANFPCSFLQYISFYCQATQSSYEVYPEACVLSFELAEVHLIWGSSTLASCSALEQIQPFPRTAFDWRLENKTVDVKK